VSDRQKVTAIATLVAVGLFGVFWLLGGRFPALQSETAFATVVPLIIAVAVLAPIIRGVRK
jgi:hypothetical protein